MRQVRFWKIIKRCDEEAFEEDLTNLMEKYDFEDFHFSNYRNIYCACILLSKKLEE